jgi:aspartyl-tRNA(Asn)/glutamyl-tRNA(Gln) amidotransferase subunit A
VTTGPWLGDACSLVDAMRKGEITALEAVDSCLAATDESELNAFSYVDADAARRAAQSADPNLPLGGLPFAVKELEQVESWPYTHASVVFRHSRAEGDSIQVSRLRAAGAIPIGLTTASEFGFVGYTSTKLNGTTRNPWHGDRTPGGSSGGSAAAVAGGSIRIPAGFCGLLGLKSTGGRIPRGPGAMFGALTGVTGCVSRSVRDTARWFDVSNGYDHRDPYSLPRVEGWEAGLGTHILKGKRAAVAPSLNGATVHPEVLGIVQRAADGLVADAGLEQVEFDIKIPDAGIEWATAGLPSLAATFGDKWREHVDELTFEIRYGLENVPHYRARHAAGVETYRKAVVEAMARIFNQVDFILCATNPWEAFQAEGPTPNHVGEVRIDPYDAGKLTRPANISGHPAISIPAGTTAAGLPVGLQVYTNRHDEALLLDLALIVDQTRPWPLVAQGAPI